MDVVNRLIYPVYTKVQLLPLQRARARQLNTMNKQGRERAYMTTRDWCVSARAKNAQIHEIQLSEITLPWHGEINRIKCDLWLNLVFILEID